MCIVWSSLFIAVLWAVFYLRLPLIAGTAVIAAVLLATSTWSGASGLVQTLYWAVFLLVAVPLNLPVLRRTLISDRVLVMFRKVMPSMSDTEREALEAGSVWWDGELFSGKPDWSKLLETPAPRLSPEERAFLDGPTNTLCQMIDDWHITQEDRDLPPEVWAYIKDNGFFSMIIPKQYGGLEFSALAHSSVVMKISSRSITAAVTIMVPNSLGPAELLLRYGTDEQKNHYLPRLATGEEVPCFALTSPEAGSDAAAMTDSGVICKGDFNGEKDVLGIRLNWEKRYITLGPVATVLGLAFKLYDPAHLLGDKEELGITCALIPTDTPGVEIGSRHFPLNQAFMNGPNRGKDVFIPLDWIIGGEKCAGQGWRMLMECLAAGRSISLPALSTGAGKLVSRATGAYARVRKQFKTPIGRFEGVEEVLARIAGLTYMMDAARTLTAAAVDLGESPSVVSAVVKYHLTENMRTVVNDAMDIHGGSGICMGPKNLMGRVYQSIPIGITVEGANILTRSLIIFGQGAIRCHPYVFREMQAVAENDAAEFDRAFSGHVGFAISNAARSLWLGLSGARLAPSPVRGPSRRCYQQLTRMSAVFALVSDISLLVLGGSLKRREKLSGRLADVLSYLYLASAALKRFEDQNRPAEDLPLLHWVCEHALYEMQHSLDGLLKNFPNRPVAWLLRALVFPLGKPFSGPTDQLGHQCADLLLSPSDARDRLTRGLYIPTEPGQALANLEHALELQIALVPLEKKVRVAVKNGELSPAPEAELWQQAANKKVINDEEFTQWQAADAARLEAISVDEFDKAALACHGKLT
ncbi:MAG: acyl-CoA dehydrogenase [Gammaproteobacteria bacterium]|nr:acyl-CoA dehydrogenase [Gammaproteobacteria bacterium]MCF6258896.1 acyl-CoA dehydrogenase [Gammaproteobacteria bacterium]